MNRDIETSIELNKLLEPDFDRVITLLYDEMMSDEPNSDVINALIYLQDVAISRTDKRH